MRTFTDAPIADRCTATITLSDGSTAQCGRRRYRGVFCWQHDPNRPSKIVERRTQVLTEQECDAFTKEDWLLLYEQLQDLRAFWRDRLDARKASP